MFPEKRFNFSPHSLNTALRKAAAPAAASMQGGVHFFHDDCVSVGADKGVDIAAPVLTGEHRREAAALSRYRIGKTPHAVRALWGAEQEHVPRAGAFPCERVEKLLFQRVGLSFHGG